MRIIPTYQKSKRYIDIFFSLTLLVFISPFVCLLAAGIFLIDKGPFLYSQGRVGFLGKNIVVWKLRTMYSDSEVILQQYFIDNPVEYENYLKFRCLDNDPRVIPFLGKFARKYSLDELPQLWNVLIGEMSLVGPRPLTPGDSAALFDNTIFERRTSVLPGITGLWQVSRSSKSDISLNIVEFDTFYLEKKSLIFDLWILWRTVFAVCSGGGSY